MPDSILPKFWRLNIDADRIILERMFRGEYKHGKLQPDVWKPAVVADLGDFFSALAQTQVPTNT